MKKVFKQRPQLLYEIKIDGYLFSTDKNKINTDYTHQFISSCYWAKNRSLLTIEQSIENSLCYGVYSNKQQIGFARIITDFTTCALLCDIFIDKQWQGKGVGKQLLEIILSAPLTTNVKFWCLATRDAHNLYKKFNFNQNSRLMCKVVTMANQDDTANIHTNN